jgi:hypothetical protein
MRKEIYLIRGDVKEDYVQFTDRMLEIANAAKSINPEALKVTLTQRPPPKLSVIPFRKKKIAVFSVYKNDKVKVDLLMRSEGFAGAYKVEEALPVAYEKTWDDGRATPGACLLTLFHRKPGIDYDTFIDRWQWPYAPVAEDPSVVALQQECRPPEAV